jgi:hypothetical protein
MCLICEYRLDIENFKSDIMHLNIQVSDGSEMIIYLNKNLELKSMGLEEYYQKYVQVYTDHHHLITEHNVLSNRFAQYELIIKTSKTMLENLRNRKNAKTQTDLKRNHDIQIMTDLTWKDIK